MTEYQKMHGERIAYRAAHNGQPNGYKPVSEAELQREKLRQESDKAFKEGLRRDQLFKALEPDASIKQDIKIIADPNFGKMSQPETYAEFRARMGYAERLKYLTD